MVEAVGPCGARKGGSWARFKGICSLTRLKLMERGEEGGEGLFGVWRGSSLCPFSFLNLRLTFFSVQIGWNTLSDMLSTSVDFDLEVFDCTQEGRTSETCRVQPNGI